MSLTEEELKLRNAGLGGSEISAVVGFNPWATAQDIYNRKRGLTPPWRGDSSTRFGEMLERPLLEWYAEETGASLEMPDYARHPDADWMLGKVDAIAHFAGEPEPVIVEAKTAHWRTLDKWGMPGTDAVPDHYRIQAAWYMAIHDLDRCDIVALLDRTPAIFTVRRDMRLERTLIARGRTFWFDHVLAGKPLPVDGSKATMERLGFTHNGGKNYADATAEMEAKGERIVAIDRQMAELEDERSRLVNEVAEAIGPDAQGVRLRSCTVFWTFRKAAKKTDWKALAIYLGAEPSEIEEYSTMGNESRYLTAKHTGN